MARSQNSYLKFQRAKTKKKKRERKLERKHDKKHQEPNVDIHDMSNLERPEELGFLPEERLVGPQLTKPSEATKTAASRSQV